MPETAALPSPATGPLQALRRYCARLAEPQALLRFGGEVTAVSPAVCEVRGLERVAALGDCVEIEGSGGRLHGGQVVRITADAQLVKTFESEPEIRLGARVWLKGPFGIRPHESWKGRIVNALGEAVDGGVPLLPGPRRLAVDRPAPPALRRARVVEGLATGVRAVDIFTPVCAGQRIGVFAGSGVGKSTFLAMLAQAPGFDTVVFALIGERGREVREFVEDAIGPAHMARAIGVVATGDESPMMRRMALKTAITIAEFFRDAGERVLLIADSVTRHAHAARDVLLAAGEAPVARGYPPGVFTELPRMLERTGPGIEGSGSITAFVSVLVDGDDHNDPVADAIRGILDGHIVLSREIAEQGRFPAIDVLASVSRLARQAWTPEQERLVAMLKSLIARYEDTRDLRLLGGWKPGTDPELDRAVAWVPHIYDVLRQAPGEASPGEDAFAALARALKAADAAGAPQEQAAERPPPSYPAAP
jgi:flagellum-specific ATP synthase